MTTSKIMKKFVFCTKRLAVYPSNFLTGAYFNLIKKVFIPK